ncbi:MAG: N-acetylglucosamine-6-phosphate deacetylase [Bacillota bacterium]
MKAIKNGKLVLQDSIIEGKILIYDDFISDIVDRVENISDFDWIDARGCYVAPGFIDIHVHGAYGLNTMDEDREAIGMLSYRLCENGVTAFLPTTITEETAKIYRALEGIRHFMNNTNGARVLGAHLEGPFINSEKKGAQNDKYILKPDFSVFENYMDVLRLVTMAPELDEDFEYIRRVSREHRTVVSMGHTNATYDQAMAAIEAGAKSATHVFNAMSGLGHRSPGVAGAVLDSDIYCELIADKIHVHPALFRILSAIKGDKLILITDSISAACVKHGDYVLGGLKVTVDSDSARLEDGTLAGSILRMNAAVRNIIESTGLPLPQVIRMVSLNPAELLGEANKLGSIQVGKCADITIFDEAIDIKATIVSGKVIYSEI